MNKAAHKSRNRCESEKGMLVIYSEKVKKERSRGKDAVKVDLFREIPAVAGVRFMCHVDSHFLIIWRYFEYFI